MKKKEGEREREMEGEKKRGIGNLSDVTASDKVHLYFTGIFQPFEARILPV
jgi:hypothetical protein